MVRRLEEMVAATVELAALPASVVQLLHVLRDPTVGTDKVVGILERDLALSANLLKLANSAYYGQQRKISSVRQAVIVLGNSALANLAIATSMTPILRRDLDTYQQSKDAFWSHALLTAAASAWVVVEGGAGEQRSQAFTAGLIHDVGKLLIDAECQNEGLDLAAVDRAAELCRHEQDLLGFDHCEAGALLAERWAFPAELVLPLRFHHAADLPQAELSGENSAALQLQIEAVRAGDLIAYYLYRMETEQLPDDAEFPPELNALGFTVVQVRDFQAHLGENIEDLLVGTTGPG